MQQYSEQPSVTVVPEASDVSIVEAPADEALIVTEQRKVAEFANELEWIVEVISSVQIAGASPEQTAAVLSATEHLRAARDELRGAFPIAVAVAVAVAPAGSL